MSQFNSMSEDFQASMRQWGDDLVSKKGTENKASSDAKEMTKLAQAFVDGPIMDWYNGLDEYSRSEVLRVFAEVKDFSSDEILKLMESDQKTTPLGLIDGLFSVVEASKNVEVIIEEGLESFETK